MVMKGQTTKNFSNLEWTVPLVVITGNWRKWDTLAHKSGKIGLLLG